MPDSFTPALGLTKPEIGASRDSWGAKTNGNWDTLDQFVSQAMPIGAILDFAGTNAPSGWLICDGRSVSRTTYSDLFAVLGTAWGAGDGTSTFNLPATNGRALVGAGAMTDEAGTAYTFGLTSLQGFVNRTIAQANLPNYNLTTDQAPPHSHGGNTQAGGGHAHTTDAQGTHSHGGATAGENANHYHTGVTNFTGEHTHQYLQATTGSGSLAAGGSATTVPAQTATSNAGAANHQHSFQTDTESNAHAHAIPVDGTHAHNVYAVGDHYHALYQDGWHTHQVPLGGGGQALRTLSPVLVVTKIIHAGNQASTRALAASAPATAFADPTDEMAAIREELATLRALLMPATRRVMSSPARGPH